MKRINRLFLMVTFFLVIFCQTYASMLPTPRNYVEDQAGIIESNYENQLNLLLKDVENKTSVQFIILTVNTTKNIPIAKYAFDLAENWQLGQKGKDNGLLLVVAVKDRKYRIEVGYGLESVLPDSFVGTVGRQNMAPNFKAGNFSLGILEATNAILGKLSSQYNVSFSGQIAVPSRPYRRVRRRRGGIGSIFGFIIMAIIFFMMPPGMRRIFLLSMLMGGRRRGYYSGGSSGFGGFSGGFGGGGGGSFGGGGAGGGW